MTAREILERDLEEIYIGNLNTVDSDLTLPEGGRHGARFSWESGQTLFISHEGKVTRPAQGVGNRKVILKVTAAYEGEHACRTFEATVLEERRRIAVKEIPEVKVSAALGERAQLPAVVIVVEESGDALTLPVSWEEDYEPLTQPGELWVEGWIEDLKRKAGAVIRYREPEKAVCHRREDEADLFSMEQIRLKEGSMFFLAQGRMVDFLEQVDDDQVLYNFRQAAGLDTRGAEPMTGWDAPACNLKGHTTGHYLSGLALAYGATGDGRLKEKLDYVVEGLALCQESLESRGCQRGFLSAYTEEQFDLLEQYVTYPTIWAPYYTLDKIMSGLCDCFVPGGCERALAVLRGMGDWVYHRLSALPQEQRQRMWSMYIAGEFGGMIGTMVRLYRLTGEERYFQAARLFGNDKLFYPMMENVDTLKDMHANQHIPQIIGALEIYRAGGEDRWLTAAENFWNFVTGRHTYTTGGTGEGEMFHGAGHLVDYLSDRTQESCASYNMLRLTGGLFRQKPSAAMMDYYENVLYNHIMATASHDCGGGTTYFMPLMPGGEKCFDTDENTCCHGTGMESRFRYREDIYVGNRERIYVNLYIPSGVTAQEFSLEQWEESQGQYRFRIRSKGEREICLRAPVWAQDFSVSVNGEVFTQREADGYLHICRRWKEQDKVEVHAGYGLRVLRSPDDASFGSIAYGPYILAELSDDGGFRPFPDMSPEKWKPDGNTLSFRVDGRSFLPLAEVDGEKYHVYFREN